MEHYLTEIKIDKLRHLSNISIKLNEDKRQHLLLTGKNGSGKTTILLAISQFLKALENKQLVPRLTYYKEYRDKYFRDYQNAQTEEETLKAKKEYLQWDQWIKEYADGIDLIFNKYIDLDDVYGTGQFITAYFPADRRTNIIKPTGVDDIKLNDTYAIDSDPGEILLKYMVHLKTQQSYAKNEGEHANAERIQKWFDRFENALRKLLDDDSIKLKYNYREYNFLICEDGKKPFGFDQLSDGYSSLIHMVSDLMLRMDKNWILHDELSSYDIEGIVLIDELETHLHIELQKKILPFLTEFFPRLQFIVTTHSPYILNSISNACAFDLEKRVELSHLSMYSTEELAEAYFDSDEYSEELKNKLNKYRKLVLKEDPSEEERSQRAELRFEFQNLSSEMSNEIKQVFDEFINIEKKRKQNG